MDPDTLHLEFWKSIGGLLQDLGNTILNWFGMGVERDDILRSASYRAAVYEAYKGNERDSVEWLLEKEISLRLDYEFKKTDIFNIPDQIIRGLKQDVMRALYLN